MITVLKGNLFDSKAQTLVNAVNCVGVMGKGIALEFKRRYPDMYSHYISKCQRGEVKPGLPYIYRPNVFNSDKQIINFPTKNHWRDSSKLEDIDRGLHYMSRVLPLWHVISLAMPALGCGLGGLQFDEVLCLIKLHLSNIHINIEVYKPLTTNLS